MSIVFNLADGHFGLVAASGISGGWVTAASPPYSASPLLYFEGLSVTSARQVTTVMDRGVPAHHKVTQRNPLQLSFSYLHTGGPGIPLMLLHSQFAADAEDLSYSTIAQRDFTYFTHCIVANQDLAEQPENNMVNVTMHALTMFHTGTAYLAY